jgi:alkylation response protein AidB-like acyl-CoA dehydrogenase
MPMSEFDHDLLDASTLLEKVRRFAREQIAPQVLAWERERRIGREAIQAAARIGLCAIEVPRPQGGLGHPYSVKCRIAEQLAAIDYAFAFSLINTHNVANKLAREAAPRLRDHYVPALMSGDLIGCTALTEPHAGSDFAAISLQARRAAGGWQLDGQKAWITNATEADVAIVYAQTEPGAGGRGIAGFVVDLHRAGAHREPGYALAGQHAIGTGGFRLEGYQAAEDEMLQPAGRAFRIALNSINGARTYVAAMCCGMVGEALDIALHHGESRRSFGVALADHQGWRWRIAEAASELAACRLLVAASAAKIDAGEDAQLAAAQAKLLATRMADRQIAVLAQAMGAVGLREDLPFGRHALGARVASFTDGSSEMMLERIAGALRAPLR